MAINIMPFSMHPGAVKTVIGISTPEMTGDTVIYLTQKRQEWLDEDTLATSKTYWSRLRWKMKLSEKIR